MSLALSEHLPLITSAPDGIQKLRGLILELAVRGKLVAQDPKDEPASELLKRIRQERSQLVGAKSRKKIELPLHTKESPLFELPRSWVWVPFGEIALHNSGKTLDKGRNAGEARDYITTSNLFWGRFELSELKRMLISDDELERCTARKDDLLICEGGEAGRAAVWPFDRQVCFQNHVHRARFMGNIDPYFGFRFFEWLNASGEIEHYRKGVGISNISGKALASIPFTLPPIAEQHRIVAKVDELMALCDRLESEQNEFAAAHTQLVETLLGTLTQSTDAADFEANWKRIAEHFDTLFTTKASIEALQKTILQMAISGKLVQQNLKDTHTAILFTETKSTTKFKHIAPLSAKDYPFKLPPSWSWVRFDSLISVEKPISYGVLVPGPDTPGGVPFVRLGDLSVNSPAVLPEKTIAPEIDAQYQRTRLEGGEILMGVVGSIGKLGVAPLSWKGANIARAVCRILPTTEINKDFLLLLLQSEFMQQSFKGNTKTLAQPTLNIGLIRLAPTPLPPLSEQIRIASKVDELMSLCDSLKKQLAESRNQEGRLADTLIQASLKAA